MIKLYPDKNSSSTAGEAGYGVISEEVMRRSE